MSASMPVFSIHEIPFSRRGSWFNLSPVVGLHQTAEEVHLVSHVTTMHPVLAVMPSSGATTVRSTPAVLSWERDGAPVVEAAFATPSVVRLRGDGASDLTVTAAADELTSFSGTYLFRDPIDGSAVFTSYETGRRYRVTVLRGSAAVFGVETLGAARRGVKISGAGGWEVAIEECAAGGAGYAPAETFDEVVSRVEAEFLAYLDAVAPWRTASTPTAALAAYVLWSATVDPAGFVTRESVLMSKHWMDKVWSWDHCFNAIALSPGLARESLDQFLAPFDHQDASGALPDSITHSEVLYNFVKPPVHGWALRRIRQTSPTAISEDHLHQVYDRLGAWTDFWLIRRTAPGHALPHYQHGNDSGWDNSTLFDRDRLVTTPDLAALLVIQLDVLADLSDELGRNETGRWRRERDRIQEALLAQLFDEDGFFAMGTLSGRPAKRRSLLRLITVVAADRFSPAVQALLASQIEGHLTRWGLATEPVDSPDYESDGYWRGPIWAPSTVLIEDGLRRSGHSDLADVVSERFRSLCERSGFAENFDAQDGAGLRDRAYTWTASAYLILAREHAARTA